MATQHGSLGGAAGGLAVGAGRAMPSSSTARPRGRAGPEGAGAALGGLRGAVPVRHRARCRSTTTHRTGRRSRSRSPAGRPTTRAGASGRCSSTRVVRAAPGAGVVRAAELLWTPEVLARFDIVGFDPRGVGRSTPAAVLPVQRRPLDQFLAGTPVLPVPGRPGRPVRRTRSGATASAACATAGRSCGTCRPPTSPGTWTCCGRRSATRGSPTTGCRTARSSATSTPTSSPDKVRALVIDGVLDPGGLDDRPPAERRARCRSRCGSDRAHGADGTLEHFLKTCEAAGPARCALAPGARAQVRPPRRPGEAGARAERSRRRAAHLRPVQQHPPGELYDSTGWEFLAEGLREIYDATFSPSAGRAGRGSALATAGFAYDNGFDAVPRRRLRRLGEPPRPAAWPRAVAQQAQTAPVFAANWTYASEPCSTWPVVERGPLPRAVRPGHRGAGARDRQPRDPATPYHGAKTVDELLPHVAPADAERGGPHLVDDESGASTSTSRATWSGATLPPVGTACAPAFRPFEQPASSAQVAARRAILPPSPGPRWGASS